MDGGRQRERDGRRFWSATLVMATTMALVVLDELGVHEFTDAMGLVVAMYVGAVPAEDGMRRALAVWVGATESGSAG